MWRYYSSVESGSTLACAFLVWDKAAPIAIPIPIPTPKLPVAAPIPAPMATSSKKF